MLLSLVDSLRCPAPHAESSLVLSAEVWSGARVMSGVLGCPVCHARYPIEHAVVDFTGGQGSHPTLQASGPDGMRLAAQLALSEPGGILLLTGRYARVAPELLGIVDATCVLVDDLETSDESAVTFRVLERLPFVDNSIRAAAVDEGRANTAFLGEVARCVRAGGRIVAPAASERPAGVQLLARDDREWVGEVVSTVPLTPLRRVTR